MTGAEHLQSHRNRPRRPAIERVWAHIAKAGPDECWLWTGSTDEKGRAKIGPAYGEVWRYAPRVILEAKLGRALLPGMEACHTCDTPPCCNDAHLYEGTHQRNVRDSVERHRHRTTPKRGEANHFAKLTATQVAAIRGDSQSAIIQPTT